MNTKLVMLLVLILVAIVLMIQNRGPVPIQLLFWSVSLPRILLIMIILLIGFAAGYVAATMKSRKADNE
jgi:uncharacterized integral membrane protein